MPGLYRSGQSRILPGDDPANKAPQANRPVVPLVRARHPALVHIGFVFNPYERKHAVDQLSCHDTLQH